MHEVVEESVTFYSNGGLRLSGLMYAPAVDITTPAPGVVMCQGFAGFKEGTPPPLARYLAARGYVVLTFDYHGFGESEGLRGRLDPVGQIDDIRCAVTYLSTVPTVDASRIHLYGMSFGGALVCQAGALDERVQSTVAVVPIGDCERWMRSMQANWAFQRLLDEVAEERVERVTTGKARAVEKYRIMVPDPETQEYYAGVVAENPNLAHADLTLESVELLMSFKPELHVHKMAGRPLLLMAAEFDLLVRPDETHSLYAHAADPKELIVVPGVGHFNIYGGETMEYVMGEAFDFYEKHAGNRG